VLAPRLQPPGLRRLSSLSDEVVNVDKELAAGRPRSTGRWAQFNAPPGSGQQRGRRAAWTDRCQRVGPTWFSGAAWRRTRIRRVDPVGMGNSALCDL
jgi:hypothetical protein